MSCLDLAGFAARLGELTVGVGAVEQALLDRATLLLETEVKRAIQDCQSALEESPLRTSDLVGSIGRTVHAPQGQVGSNHPEIEYGEFGSRTTHPRSFLRGSAFRKGREIRDLIGDRFFRHMAGMASEDRRENSRTEDRGTCQVVAKR